MDIPGGCHCRFSLREKPVVMNCWRSFRGAKGDDAERIPSGEARRYLRSEPDRSRHIPFGQRQFVQRIEQRIREAGRGR